MATRLEVGGVDFGASMREFQREVDELTGARSSPPTAPRVTVRSLLMKSLKRPTLS